MLLLTSDLIIFYDRLSILANICHIHYVTLSLLELYVIFHAFDLFLKFVKKYNVHILIPVELISSTTLTIQLYFTNKLYGRY